jgi:ribosome maturation factor RimP
VLDVEDAISGEYVLEVSSPGMDRPLYELAQYERYIGEDVSLRLRFAYDGRRNFKGRLVGVDGDEIVLVVADTEYLFPVEGIDKANVVPRF